ncbi:MarR family winged helix-turn-helix transcriptional regulator [Amycolatopsis sp.]|uniref:MarR family winged helix-turn-helix transcriptional regulator n=1 Tax=Amycolatopsis sp. TaxID=37632 RepID=UPI002BD25893|nr:MarR family transcriptional regulator [Amycolatopsis sp.]HVV08524.1 MarR family transcriptional regulator [Amycolatopsis sp.]
MTEAAERVWERMRVLVMEKHDRRKAVVDALGMSFVKTKVLRRLAKRPMTMRELADELLTDRPYVTVLVDGLEERGLVRRTVHPEDRRARIVQVTDEGRAHAERAAKILATPPDTLLALPAEDVAKLDEILARVAD